MANLRAFVVVVSLFASVWTRELTFGVERSTEIRRFAAADDGQAVETLKLLRQLLDHLEEHLAAGNEATQPEMFKETRDGEEHEDEKKTRNYDVQHLADVSLDIADCQCAGSNCSCCAKIDLKVFQTSCCAVVRYEAAKSSVFLELTMNGRVVVQQSFSVEKIPPLCYKTFGFKVCLVVRDVKFVDKKLDACVDIDIGFSGFTQLIPLGCIHLGA